MASTIQDCASLSAAERRQKRKDRILGGADDRLEKILPGMSSDDMNSSTSTAKEFNMNSSTSTAKDFNMDEMMADDTQSVTAEETMNATQELDYVEPNYMDLIDIHRVQACVFAGVLLRLMTLLHVVDAIFPIWAPLSITYHVYLITQAEKKFPKHGYIVNFLLAGGLNEGLVRYVGFVMDTLWGVSTDTMIMIFGFLSAHIIIFAVNLML